MDLRGLAKVRDMPLPGVFRELGSNPMAFLKNADTRLPEVMMRTARAVALAAILPLVAFPALGRAQLITSASDIPASATQVDLSAYYLGYWTSTKGPLSFNGGAITWQSNGYSSIGNDRWQLNGNGIWTSAMPSAAIAYEGSIGDFTFTFTSPVSFFSAFMNYYPFGYWPNTSLTALGPGGTVLDTYDINQLAPISTQGGVNAGAVRGISHSSADIYGVRFSNGYVIGRDFRFVSGDPVISPLPEPASMALMATGLFGLVGAVRRRRANL